MEQLTGTMSSVPDSNNYENMSHKPKINGVELAGNKTSEELGLGGGEVTRKELEDALIKTYMSVGVKLNHKKAVSLITMLRNKRMIVQETGRKYTFMPDFHY